MLDEIIQFALREDIGEGDHSTLACVPKNATGVAKLLVKENGILAGVEVAKRIYELYDPSLDVEYYKKDGDAIEIGEIVLQVKGSSQSILSTERLVLNFMQRMSGIASQTARIVKEIEGCSTKLLDTRKTTPGIRYLEKMAVKIGGGENHRFGLYDMVMLKDNHNDYAGGITAAIQKTKHYLAENNKDLRIEIEVRNMEELNEVLQVGGVQRIMLDNFTPAQLSEALKLIPREYETEASGGITLETIRSYAETGVQFISVGALTHSVKSLDLSLKAVFQS
ncbi:MAG: carboxylating nicotinate-nucleotide diphosphorylase [Flavobacteriales bacterium]|nr:carboxylating nicotinate-nucleotide diphosphorylase [Crocinitomicaceae bacterium]NBX80513.1 carboxylating nicotinate-nucleotide diphosphorylase [Flavobacteriales bacterium]NCA21565.1 carboxylating nicotinate-nucleotide diphosphorylase [Crocinitomicaceae bacterium]